DRLRVREAAGRVLRVPANADPRRRRVRPDARGRRRARRAGLGLRDAGAHPDLAHRRAGHRRARASRVRARVPRRARRARVTAATTVEPRPSLVRLAHAIYALHAFSLITGIVTTATVVGAFLTGWPSIIAVILNYAKRS